MRNSNKVNKILKILEKDKVQELDDMIKTQLETQIVTSSSSIKQAQDELEANPKYQELKESLKALSAGLKDVKKRQNAIIQYALLCLEQKDSNNERD